MGGVFGLDFAAVIRLAELSGAATPMLAEVLPRVESIIVAALRPEEEP